MKTIFCGEINGKKFDNVQDYNAEMNRLLVLGEAIDAHSHTETAKTEPKTKGMYPGFEHCVDADHLDDLFVPEGLKFSREVFDKKIEKAFDETIEPNIAIMDEKAAKDYVANVEKILAHLFNISADYDSNMGKLKNELTRLDQELDRVGKEIDELSDKKDIVDITGGLYTSIRDALADRLGTINAAKKAECRCCEDKKSGCCKEQDCKEQDCKEQDCKCEDKKSGCCKEQDCKEAETMDNLLEKLYKTIFG